MKIFGIVFGLGLIFCFGFNTAVSAIFIPPTPPGSGVPGSFVYRDGKTYCGVAFVAWVQDYSTRQHWYDICTQGDCAALDVGTTYNYVSALKSKGYLVIKVGDFTADTFFDGFQKALCIADYYNTRLFVISHAHGYVFGGFTTHDESEVINTFSFMAFLKRPDQLSDSRLNALGLGYMKGKLNGGMLELVYYIASCFALGGYGELYIGGIYATDYWIPLMSYASKGAVFGVVGMVAKFGDVSGFRTNFLIQDEALKPAYKDACWTFMNSIITWGGLDKNTYKLVEMP